MCVSSVHVASLATVDLWAKLERHHSGEVDSVTIKRQWDRCHYQGRNLDGDFDVVDTIPVRQAARTPMPPAGYGGGCTMLAPTPPHGGLAAQVLAPLVREERWECQPHRVPADLLHLDPHRRGRWGHHGQLFPGGLDWYGPVMAHEPA
jgi:hypothetical protein